MIIETLVLMNEKAQAAPLVKELAKRLSSNGWYSTQTTAYGLLAISKFAAGGIGKEIRFNYVLNGKQSADQLTNKTILTTDLKSKLKGNTFEFTNTSKNLLYVRVIRTGQPLNGDEQASANDLAIDVKYTDLAGLPIDVTRMEQGTDFLAEVSITHPGVRNRYDELALTQIFPSGWEIINSRLEVSAGVLKGDVPEYQDFRDDRVYSYFDLYPRQSQKFIVKLNSTYLGKYYLPSVSCEAMYDNTINARTKGMWVEVVATGSKVGTAMK